MAKKDKYNELLGLYDDADYVLNDLWGKYGDKCPKLNEAMRHLHQSKICIMDHLKSTLEEDRAKALQTRT